MGSHYLPDCCMDYREQGDDLGYSVRLFCILHELIASIMKKKN